MKKNNEEKILPSMKEKEINPGKIDDYELKHLLNNPIPHQKIEEEFQKYNEERRLLEKKLEKENKEERRILEEKIKKEEESNKKTTPKDRKTRYRDRVVNKDTIYQDKITKPNKTRKAKNQGSYQGM
jgi:hypothetical protein